MEKKLVLTPELKEEMWGAGEWVNEGDYIYFKSNGFECICQRCAYADTFGGHINGYIAIPKEHPWNGKGCDEIDVEVHGGLTYAESDCNSDNWIIGFDCAHADDLVPFIQHFRSRYREELGEATLDWWASRVTYKNMEFVKDQCCKLAAQAKKAQDERLDL